jgi:membrane-associated phospholipid phosphatase
MASEICTLFHDRKDLGTALVGIALWGYVGILPARSEGLLPGAPFAEQEQSQGAADTGARQPLASTARLHPAVDPNHDLTVGEFGMDILRNMGGLFSKRNIVPALIGGAATGLATIPEDDLANHFAPTDVWGAWSRPGNYIPYIETGASGVMFLVSRKSTNQKFRSVSYALVQAMIIDAAVTYPLKAAVHRMRPNGEDHSSFPSNHTSRAFTFATVVTKHYGWKAAVPGYLVAAYVGATRLEERKHYLSDVVGGATIGFLIGYTASNRMKSSPARPARIDWMVLPGFKAVRFRVAIRLG